jgi:hypothetical protein
MKSASILNLFLESAVAMLAKLLTDKDYASPIFGLVYLPSPRHTQKQL